MTPTLAAVCLFALSIATTAHLAGAHEAAPGAGSSVTRCLPASSLTPEMAPPTLYGNVVHCWVAGAKDDARHAFFLAGLYGRYDAPRVGDRTAHQAISVLQMQVGEALGAETQAMVDAFQKADDPPSRRQFCVIAERIGPPAYTPGYMTSHGMDAFTGKVSPTPAAFERVSTWKEILRTSVGCMHRGAPARHVSGKPRPPTT